VSEHKKYSLAALIEQGCLQLTPVSDSPRLDAQVLLCFVLDKPETYLLTWPEKLLPKSEVNAFFALIKRRAAGEPVAYITGVKEFWSLPLAVSPVTLIPRPDTETLVEQVLFLYQDRYDNTLRCLDLGTGTGAIALALASERPNWLVEAVDFNPDAVKLAQKNAEQLGLSRVSIYLSCWFEQVDNKQLFDIIVSNPPYIDPDDRHLSEGDVRFEPKSALVAEDKGLADIRHIADKARSYLNSKGSLFFEHGYEQGVEVRTILTELGYVDAQTMTDLSGNDRITWAYWQADNNN